MKAKAKPVDRLREQIKCLRECAQHLSDLAPEMPPDTETISLIAHNLRVTADSAANLLAPHGANDLAEKIARDSANERFPNEQEKS